VNFRTLTSQFRKNFHDQKGVELLHKVEHGDEIEEMIEGMEGLSQHLFETDRRLKEYAADLERKVERRTAQLSQENDVHRKDLTMLVSVLGALKISRNRPELWRNALPLLADRFQLVRVSYICTFSGNQDFTWPPEAQAPALPADYVELLLQPKLRFIGNQVFVPVGSSDDNIDGLLLLERPDDAVFSENEAEMLTAVGRQLGIAAENLAALDAILSQTDNLQTIFESIPDPLLLLDLGGSVIMANNAANRLIDDLSRQGRERGVIDGLLQPDKGEGKTQDNADQLTTPATREVELDNGRSFIVNTIGLAHDENRPPRVVVAIQEDTDRKKMLHQFVQAEKMGTVGKLAAGLAHELNNPLGVILCYAELLKRTLNNDQHRADIEVIIKHTSQAQAVLLDLLNFARPKVSTHRETVIGDVVESVTGVFRVQAAKKGVTLSCHRTDGGKVVRVEPQVVEHIVLNLLLNALDALPEEGGTITVHITCDLEQRGLRLTVTDNGSGIDPAILPSIFDPFFTTKDVNEGSGLGLAVIYGFMHELGGTIEARNLPKGGAVFDLYFPLAPAI
jgi:C4-dicarboxylate-specific signal transduction histidine kinase